MNIDISRFKVIHNDKVLNAICIMEVQMAETADWNNRKTYETPKFVDVLAINEDGNIVIIHDEAWTFQFVPIVSRPD